MKSVRVDFLSVRDAGSAALAGSIVFLASALACSGSVLPDGAWCGPAMLAQQTLLGHCATCWQAAIGAGLVVLSGLRLRRAVMRHGESWILPGRQTFVSATRR